jgi:predicted metal-dependent peptidase
MEQVMHENNETIAVACVAKARAELILSRTFYGVLVAQVEPKPSRQFPTMATNGVVHFFNPDFIVGLNKNHRGEHVSRQRLVLGVQAHESEHDARRHHTRRGNRDPFRWNVACDYAINPDLIDEGFDLPWGALIDYRYKGMSAEAIYRSRELDDEKKRHEQQKPQADEDETEDGRDDADTDPGQSESADEDSGDGDDGDDEGDAGDEDGQGGQGEGQGGEGDEDGQDGQDGGQGGQGSPQEGGDEVGDGEGQGSGESTGETSDDDGEAGQPSSGDPGGCGEVLDAADNTAEMADQNAKWERVVRQAAMLAAKRGDAPGHVAREIGRSDHAPQDWRETLRAYFDAGAASRETWNRPNRRFIGSGLYLPGREREGINKAVFMIDTSGSMVWCGGKALEAIAVETQAALDEHIIDEVVVLYGDTRVTRVDTYHPGEEIEFDPRGGGGTVLAPLFDHVRDEHDDAKLIVAFTDGDIDDVTQGGTVEPPCEVLWAFCGYPQNVKAKMVAPPWGAPAIDVGA